MTKNLPSPELLRKLLRYDPDTGKLFWRERSIEMFSKERCAKSWNTRFSGAVAFPTLNSDGYFVGRIFRKTYSAHRVAWAIFTGEWPAAQIDHINGDRSDNCINNLREATCAQNMYNQGVRESNRSGFKGVSWNSRNSKWKAQIRIAGKKKYLGYFATPQEAHEAYCQAARKHHKEFANTKNTLKAHKLETTP